MSIFNGAQLEEVVIQRRTSKVIRYAGNMKTAQWQDKNGIEPPTILSGETSKEFRCFENTQEQ